jgi:hypothetical protein
VRSRPTVAQALVLVLLAACRGERSDSAPAPSASVAPKPVDRLAPGELAPGEEHAFGLKLPKGMRVIGRFAKTVHAAGDLPPEDVANYLREHVAVERVELGAARTIFPNARIKNAPPSKRFQLEVIAASKKRTVLEVEDVTPAPPLKGLPEPERWKRVGIGSDGKLMQPEKLE